MVEYWLFCRCGRKFIAHPPEIAVCPDCGRKYIWKGYRKDGKKYYVYAGR